MAILITPVEGRTDARKRSVYVDSPHKTALTQYFFVSETALTIFVFQI